MTANEPTPSLNTCWTLLLQAHSEDQVSREKAWEWFVKRYRQPVLAYFRTSGVSAADAEVLAQDFFADLFRRGSLGRITREGGRFRTWLYACLRKRAIDDYRKQTHHLDAATVDGPDPRDASRPDAAFDQAWATHLLGQAIAALEARYSGDEERLALFRCFLAHATGEPSKETFAAIAEKLGMHHGSVRNAHALFKERMRNELRITVAATVASEDEIDGEIAHLRRVLAQ